MAQFQSHVESSMGKPPAAPVVLMRPLEEVDGMIDDMFMISTPRSPHRDHATAPKSLDQLFNTPSSSPLSVVPSSPPHSRTPSLCFSNSTRETTHGETRSATCKGVAWFWDDEHKISGSWKPVFGYDRPGALSVKTRLAKLAPKPGLLLGPPPNYHPVVRTQQVVKFVRKISHKKIQGQVANADFPTPMKRKREPSVDEEDSGDLKTPTKRKGKNNASSEQTPTELRKGLSMSPSAPGNRKLGHAATDVKDKPSVITGSAKKGQENSQTLLQSMFRKVKPVKQSGRRRI